MSDAVNKAVFLSYASQDAEAAKKICFALRAVGVEVWFDQNELVGGDAWDQKIRRQIKDCTLFVPIISANTQARTEGYFRLEWRIADQRTHLMAKGRPFLLPVVIDDTRDADAHVPDSFTEVQWTRLLGGETTEKFCQRVQKLLGGETVFTGSDIGASLDGTRGRGRATLRQNPSRSWLAPTLIGLTALAALAIWRPWKNPASTAAAVTTSPPVAATGATTEIAQVRMKLRPDEWTRADFNAFAPVVDRLVQTYPENGDAWALRSIASSLLVIRNFETGTKPLESGKAAIDTALRMAPNSPLAELGLGLHLVAMISRGGDVRASRPHIERGLAGLPSEPLTRYAELVSYWLGYQFEGADRSAHQWLAAEPHASFPAWILGQSFLVRRQPAESVKWSEQAAADPDITGARALVTLFEARYYLQADLAGARTALDRVPAGQRGVHRVVSSRFLLAMAERHFDQALQELARVPESMLLDRVYHGPKALLAGFAHQSAGRNEVAQSQFRDAERMLREELTHDSENQELRTVLALNLAALGRSDDAHRELAAIEPLLNDQAPTVYSGQLIALIAQTHGLLGDKEALRHWLRRTMAERTQLPFTPASLRLDSRFAAYLDDPEIQAQLKEFASLDQPPENVAAAAPDAPAVALAKADQKSVAVLAFANLSDDKENEYFSDGISEELLNVLGRVPGLRVAAPMSAFSFKGKNVPAQEIGQKLNVAYLVNGSVRRAGPAIRVVARLSRADTEEQIWTEKFEGEARNVFALQDEIAGKIAAALSLKLGASARAAKPIDPEAYRLYLEGRHLWSLRNLDSLDGAEVALATALRIEPESALIHAGLAELYGTRASYRNMAALPEVGDLNRATEEADRAIALDPKLSHGYVARATIAWARQHYAEAERMLRESLALAPNDALAFNRLGDVMISAGRLDAGLENYQRALQLDPLSLFIVKDVVRESAYAHRFQEAIETATRFEAAAPRDARLVIGRFHAQIQLGMVEQTAAELKALLSTITPDNFPGSGVVELVFYLRDAKLEAESEALAKELLSRYGPNTYLHAMVLMARGRTEEALPLLKPFPPGSQDRLYWSPIFDPVREDPRFLRKVEELGVAAEYKVARATLARMLKEQEAKK